MVTATHGTVNWVKVSSYSDFGFFSVSPAGGGLEEAFIIWSRIEQQETPSVTQRLLWMSQLALVRDALIAKVPIIVFHDDTSSFVRSVEIGAT